MTIQIKNQKPALLFDNPFSVLPDIKPTLSATEFDEKIEAHIRTKYIEPMYHPINAAHPVRIEDIASGTPQQIDQDMLYQSVMHLWTNSTLDVQLQDQVSDIYRQGIQYHAPNDWYFEEQLGVEALTRMKLPIPSQKSGKIIRYTASVDVIPTAKNFLAQADAMSATNWFGNMAAYTHERPIQNYLLLTVQTSDIFEDLKQQIKNFTQVWQTTQPISKEVNKLLADFDKISLAKDLSTGLFLPGNGLGNPTERDSMSFSRIIMYALSQYEKNGTPGAVTVQPTNLQQLYIPENLVILNLENYAHAKPAEIKADWDTLEKALNAKKALRFVSNKKLLTAKAVARNMGGGDKASSASGDGRAIERAKVTPFSGKPIPAANMLRMMKGVIQSQITKLITQNTYKSVKSSFMRANRRNPDDINLPGKLSSTMYRPDVHIYMDTSGSISEKNFRDGVTNLIMLTKSINCNLYITSFSHVVSQTSLLLTKDRSVNDIYQQFLKIPKVTGGTDFEHVWRKIDLIQEMNVRSNQSHQINFVITDFGYNMSRDWRWHPDQASMKHTYYVPISADAQTWKYLLRYAKDFRKQMAKAGDRSIRKRMLL